MTTEENNANRRACERFAFDEPIEFYVDADIVQAMSVDVSQTGISFETSRPLVVEMRINVDGQREEHRARLIWARKGPDGSFRYGLEFLADDDMRNG